MQFYIFTTSNDGTVEVNAISDYNYRGTTFDISAKGNVVFN